MCKFERGCSFALGFHPVSMRYDPMSRPFDAAILPTFSLGRDGWRSFWECIIVYSYADCEKDLQFILM
jgi:hypothetical protein